MLLKAGGSGKMEEEEEEEEEVGLEGTPKDLMENMNRYCVLKLFCFTAGASEVSEQREVMLTD